MRPFLWVTVIFFSFFRQISWYSSVSSHAGWFGGTCFVCSGFGAGWSVKEKKAKYLLFYFYFMPACEGFDSKEMRRILLQSNNL